MIEYYPIKGTEIDNTKNIKNPIIQSIVTALNVFEGFIKSISLKANDEKESLILDFHLDEPQILVNDILSIERIEIASNEKELPKVYALRVDFPNDLPHLNSSNPNIKRELCIHEEHWDELKHNWTATKFLLQIKQWLEFTALGKLHQGDQLLEPFLNTPYTLLVSDFNSCNSIKKLSNNIFEANSEKHHQSNDSYILIKHEITQEHGIIFREPSCLKELLQAIPEFDILKIIKVQIDGIMDFPDRYDKQVLNNRKLIIILSVNLIREKDSKPEKKEYYGFLIDSNIKEIGRKAEILITNPTNHNELIRHTLIGQTINFNQSAIDDISVIALNLMPKFNYQLANSLNNRNNKTAIISLIGCGALGSQLLGNLSRQGFGKWYLFDDDILLPHNLNRHFLFQQNIAKPKVESMKKFVNQGIFNNEKIVLSSFNKKVQESESDKKMDNALLSSDLILDISTSISAAKYLVKKYPHKRKISAFLNPNGTDLVILTENTDISLDLLEMQYYQELVTNETLEKHLNINNDSRIRYAMGCRDITSKISQDNLSIFAGILSKKIKEKLNNTNSEIEIWKLNENLSITTYHFESYSWEKIKLDEEWDLHLCSSFQDKISSFRNNRLPKETGGIILGGIDFHYKNIYITDTIPAPIDSIEKPTLFIRGIIGVAPQLKKISDITNDSIRYLGEWHSHPKNSSTNPSEDDKTLFAELYHEGCLRGEPTIMMILGDTQLNILYQFSGDNNFKSITSKL